MFVHKEVYFKTRIDLSINSNYVESLFIEIHYKKYKNILFRVIYGSPNADMTVFENFLKNLLSTNDKTLKNIIFAGDLNINVLEFESNKKLQHFLSSMFQFNMIRYINKPNHVTRNTGIAVYHIITNTVTSSVQHRSGIIKTDISNHFSTVFLLNTCEKSKPENKAQFIYKTSTEKKKIDLFKHELSQIGWNNIIKILDNLNTTYESVFDIFFKTYDKYFPKFRIKRKAKTIQTIGFQKALETPLRRNKSFMNNFWKSVLHRMNKNTKIVKDFSKKLKRKQRKYTTPTNYLNVLYILKKTWNVMKNIIGKSKNKIDKSSMSKIKYRTNSE